MNPPPQSLLLRLGLVVEQLYDDDDDEEEEEPPNAPAVSDIECFPPVRFLRLRPSLTPPPSSTKKQAALKRRVFSPLVGFFWLKKHK